VGVTPISDKVWRSAVAERGQKIRGGEFHRKHKLGTKNGQVTEQIPG
jgi:hypothetical protein